MIGGGSMLFLMIEAPLILMAALLYTYIMQISTCYSG